MVIRKYKTACMQFLLDSASPEHIPIRAAALVESPPTPKEQGWTSMRGEKKSNCSFFTYPIRILKFLWKNILEYCFLPWTCLLSIQGSLHTQGPPTFLRMEMRHLHTLDGLVSNQGCQDRTEKYRNIETVRSILYRAMKWWNLLHGLASCPVKGGIQQTFIVWTEMTITCWINHSTIV